MKQSDNAQNPLEVVYQDNHQLVVIKPAGLLTQPSGTDQPNLEALAKAWVKEHFNKPGNVFLEAVHRLDKPVSGLVLFGRTSKALTRLHESLREKKARKIYIALVEGCPGKPEGVLEHYLVHEEHHASVSISKDPKAKLSRLTYRVLKKSNGLSLLEIELDTGRYHQIRAQLAANGTPILGDLKYGSRQPFVPNVIALHHSRLEIPHPITGEMQVFEAPIPDFWSK